MSELGHSLYKSMIEAVLAIKNQKPIHVVVAVNKKENEVYIVTVSLSR